MSSPSDIETEAKYELPFHKKKQKKVSRKEPDWVVLFQSLRFGIYFIFSQMYVHQALKNLSLSQYAHFNVKSLWFGVCLYSHIFKKNCCTQIFIILFPYN